MRTSIIHCYNTIPERLPLTKDDVFYNAMPECELRVRGLQEQLHV